MDNWYLVLSILYFYKIYAFWILNGTLFTIKSKIDGKGVKEDLKNFDHLCVDKNFQHILICV